MSRKTPGQFSLGGVTSLVEGHFWIQNQSQDWWPPSSYVAVHVTSYKVLWSKFTCQFLAFKNNFDIFAFYLKHKSLNLKKPIKLLESPNYKCRFGKKQSAHLMNFKRYLSFDSFSKRTFWSAFIGTEGNLFEAQLIRLFILFTLQ